MQRISLFLVFLFAYFLSYFFRSTNAVIADDLSRDLNLSPEQLGLMTGVFFIAFAVAQLPIGPALDRYGAKQTTIVLMVFAVIGAIIFATASSFFLVLLGRALIGMGMAGVLMGALKAFSAWFSARAFATASGIFVSLGSCGALLAATPLVWLTNHYGWRQAFIGGAALTVISILLLLIFAKDAPKTLEFTQTITAQHGSLRDVFTHAGYWRIAFLNFMMVGSFFAYQGLWMGPFLQDGLGLTQLATGNMLLLLGLGVVGGYFISGWLASRFGVPRVVFVCALVFFISQLILAFFQANWSLVALRSVLVLFGITGAFNVMLFSHVRQTFPLHLTGRALALTNLFGIGGSALMQWFFGVIVSLYPLANATAYAPEAFRSVFLITALPGLLSVVMYASFLRAPKPNVSAAQ